MPRAAVIGVGHMGQHHARVYADLEDVDLVAVADTNETQLRRVAKHYRARGYADYHEMLDKEKIDLLTIALPTYAHKEAALAVFDRKIDVLLEKPIAGNSTEAAEIIATAARTGSKLIVGHIERFNPAVIALKEKISQGTLGDIYKIEVIRIGPFPGHVGDVGVSTDLAVHDIDIIEYVLHKQVTKVYANFQKKVHPTHEDMLTAMLHYQDGIVCNMSISWLSPIKIRQISFLGEKGLFRVNYLYQGLFFYENSVHKNGGFIPSLMLGSEGNMTKFHIEKKEPLRSELEHFINYHLDKEAPVITGEEALKSLKIVEYMKESADRDEIVRL
ncbi:MAG: Gfo/Idh/MocA family oxidoreductase [Deltaproteobacteria bacterium]|nr:Gfo/Idh/MocA family oxidoreductase [Deltaproteobacteria bacterium]